MACPKCGQRVPERETFGGQGAHYFRVLFSLTLAVVAIFFLLSVLGSGINVTISRLISSRWSWLYFILFLIPIGIGLYTWSTLRNEEITVTDMAISRRSRWGNQQLLWSQVRSFHRIPFLPKRSWIRRFLSLRRIISRERLIWHLPPQAYELVGYENDEGAPAVIRLEPGTIDELPWLLALIQEHVGPPVED
ncbi:MAG: hypothetical protein ACYC6L_10790 [Anaerolineae bacterium]